VAFEGRGSTRVVWGATAKLNNSPQMRAPRFGARRKAQTCAITVPTTHPPLKRSANGATSGPLCAERCIRQRGDDFLPPSPAKGL